MGVEECFSYRGTNVVDDRNVVGTRVLQFVDLSCAEPDPAMFQVPAGFVVEDLQGTPARAEIDTAIGREVAPQLFLTCARLVQNLSAEHESVLRKFPPAVQIPLLVRQLRLSSTQT